MLAAYAFIQKPGYSVKRSPFDLLSLQRRQLDPCANECYPIAPIFGGCNSTGQCVCPTLNAAGPAIVNACVTCLAPLAPTIASNISLAEEVCSTCEAPCTDTLIAYVQSGSCNTTQCICSYYATVGAAEISNCTNCVETFNLEFANGVLELAQACGIVAVNSSMPGYNSSSPNATSSGNITIPTVTTSAAAAPSTTGSSNVSGAMRFVDALFSKFIWITIILGIAGFIYILG